MFVPFGCTPDDVPGGDEENTEENTPEETKLPDPVLSWSAASCTQTIEEENPAAYPTLTVDPADLNITFASSNTSVATVDGSGNITLVAPSTSTISATFAGDDAINCQGELDVTGGYVYAYSSANDAMDANHDLKISGGYVFAVTTRGAPEVALDENTEENYKLYITGGVVVAYGGLEGGYSASNTVYTMNCTADGLNALHDGSSYIAAFKAPAGVSSVAVCAPSLKKGYKGMSVGGDTYAGGTWATTSISGGSSVSLGTYTGGGGPGGNPPGGGPGGGH